MYLRRNNKVPQWNRNCLLYALIILTSSLFGQVCTSSDNSNINNYNAATAESQTAANQQQQQRKIPPSGSGGGGMEKRSSYAVISQAFSDTVNNEFGSKFSRHMMKIAIARPRLSKSAAEGRCMACDVCFCEERTELLF